MNKVDTKIKKNESRKMFILPLTQGEAIISYEKKDGVYHLYHSEVPTALRGQGIGKELVDKAMEVIKAEGARVRPVCSYIHAVVNRNEEWRKLAV